MFTPNPNVKSFWPGQDYIEKEIDSIELAIFWEEFAILNEEALLLMRPCIFTYFIQKDYDAWKALKESV
jgi:hypothetical protein